MGGRLFENWKGVAVTYCNIKVWEYMFLKAYLWKLNVNLTYSKRFFMAISITPLAKCRISTKLAFLVTDMKWLYKPIRKVLKVNIYTLKAYFCHFLHPILNTRISVCLSVRSHAQTSSLGFWNGMDWRALVKE